MGRGLAAILAADVVGYSKMMGESEAEALAMLQNLRDEIVEPTISQYRGQVVKRMGDGWPSEPITPFRLSLLAIGHALKGNMEAALRCAREGYERKPFVPIHIIAYAAAAAGDKQHVRSDESRKIIMSSGLTLDQAKHLPLSPEAADRMIELLRGAGVAEERGSAE